MKPRQVLLTRAEIYGFDIAFVGISPSVELMALAREGKVKFFEDKHHGLRPPARGSWTCPIINSSQD